MPGGLWRKVVLLVVQQDLGSIVIVKERYYIAIGFVMFIMDGKVSCSHDFLL